MQDDLHAYSCAPGGEAAVRSSHIHLVLRPCILAFICAKSYLSLLIYVEKSTRKKGAAEKIRITKVSLPPDGAPDGAPAGAPAGTPAQAVRLDSKAGEKYKRSSQVALSNKSHGNV